VRQRIGKWLIVAWIITCFFSSSSCDFHTNSTLPSPQLLRMAAIHPPPSPKTTSSSSLPSGPGKDEFSR
jgi:hypothetical protein